ncbi:hypothetical protein QAD02_016258 [Eretmocerus hayati]|uniref:Uncharacterized protein n=1 Tax=Eretmocerus hayati TaxID=131215 RepID=A0ACC2PCD9_9HYME|nr:hypothetical protein QAD02_016258 [Eretmocerus hayati]
MMQIFFVYVITLTLLMTHGIFVSSPVQNLSATITDQSDSFLTVDPTLLEDGYLITAQCKIDGYVRRHIPDTSCIIGVQKFPSRTNSREYTKKCEIKLMEISDFARTAGYQVKEQGQLNFELKHLNMIKPIIKWSLQFKNHIYFQVRLINMADCSTHSLSFAEEVDKQQLLGNLLIYNNTFDVLTADTEICGFEKCRVGYTHKGKRMGIPKPFMTTFDIVHATAVIDEKGVQHFFVMNFNHERIHQLSYVNASGSEVYLKLFPKPKLNYVPASNAHHKFGLCFVQSVSNESNIQCVQYDSSVIGQIYYKVNLKASKDSENMLLGVHNLAINGFLLLTSHCDEQNGRNLRCKNLFITRVLGDRKVTKVAREYNVKFKCNFSLRDTQVHVSENNSEICFYVSCSRSEEVIDGEVEMGLDIRSACVPKDKILLSQ